MRRTLLSFALANIAIACTHASDVAQRIQGELPQVTAWRRDIHQHPELGNRETRTAALVAAQLKQLGLEVHTGIAHHGVVGILKGGKPGPKLALRADMDALPVTEDAELPFASKAQGEYRGKATGVMHACGHDAHTAMLLGLATVLAGMKQELPGEVMFLFQPAEEGPPAGEQGGAPLMLREGVLRDFAPGAIFAMHVISTLNVGTVALRPGPALSGADGFKLVVHGRQTHGAMPWQGVDPIVTAAQIVNQAQTIVSRRLDISTLPAVLSFGIVEGGARHNIVPDQVELQGTLRTFDPAMRQHAIDSLRGIAEHAAAANGATLEAQIPMGDSYPVTVNDAALTARVRASLIKALGSAQVLEAPLAMPSEDFAYFAREVPGVYFFVGATPTGQDAAKAPANHSPRFFMDEDALRVGMTGMLQATLDYLHAPTPAAPAPG